MSKELKITQQIDLALAKVLVLANLINRKTEMCCFAEDTAHCEYIEIRLYDRKDNYNGVPAKLQIRYKVDSELDWMQDNQSRLEECERGIEFLENVLNDKKIDYSDLYAVTERVITSYEI